MNYANDPFWAHKSGYSPERLQAYENQVMADRAAHERHRTEFDYAAVATSAVLLGTWFQGRAARKQAKARRAYEREHKPQDYSRRRMEYGIALDRMNSEIANALGRLEAEAEQLQLRLPLAGSAKTHRTLKARLDAVTAMIADKRLAYDTAREALSMKYRDILEYDAAIEAL